MANDEMKQIWKVPEPTLRRLPWYLAFLKLMKGRGETFVSSTQIAKEINVDPSQVAKDLSFVNISGKTRVGYEIGTLVLRRSIKHSCSVSVAWEPPCYRIPV